MSEKQVHHRIVQKILQYGYGETVGEDAVAKTFQNFLISRDENESQVKATDENLSDFLDFFLQEHEGGALGDTEEESDQQAQGVNYAMLKQLICSRSLRLPHVLTLALLYLAAWQNSEDSGDSEEDQESQISEDVGNSIAYENQSLGQRRKRVPLGHRRRVLIDSDEPDEIESFDNDNGDINDVSDTAHPAKRRKACGPQGQAHIAKFFPKLPLGTH